MRQYAGQYLDIMCLLVWHTLLKTLIKKQLKLFIRWLARCALLVIKICSSIKLPLFKPDITHPAPNTLVGYWKLHNYAEITCESAFLSFIIMMKMKGNRSLIISECVRNVENIWTSVCYQNTILNIFWYEATVSLQLLQYLPYFGS